MSRSKGERERRRVGEWEPGTRNKEQKKKRERDEKNCKMKEQSKKGVRAMSQPGGHQLTNKHTHSPPSSALDVNCGKLHYLWSGG